MSSWFAASTIYDWGYLIHHITCTEHAWVVTANRSIRLLVSRYCQCCSKTFRIIKCDRVTTYAAMDNGESMHTDIEVERTHKAALKSKVYSANVEIQNIAKVVQTMQNMMMSNTSANLVGPGSAVREKPKK